MHLEHVFITLIVKILPVVCLLFELGTTLVHVLANELLEHPHTVSIEPTHMLDVVEDADLMNNILCHDLVLRDIISRGLLTLLLLPIDFIIVLVISCDCVWIKLQDCITRFDLIL